MKKKVLLVMLLFTAFIITGCGSDPAEKINENSSAVLIERNEDNNYGVNKKWEMTEEKINYAKKTPYVDVSKKIYDFSDILTKDEETELRNIINPLVEKYKMDIVIITYDLPYREDSENSDFVADFYDFNDFGLNFDHYSGVVLFRNTYEKDPYYDMFSFGDAQLKFYDTRMSSILDDIFDYIKVKDYMDAFKRWLKNVEKYANSSSLEGYYIDDNGFLQKE